jgi:hypothetical protein
VGLSPSTMVCPPPIITPLLQTHLPLWAQVQWANLSAGEGTNVENHITFLVHSADAVATNSTFTAVSHRQPGDPFSVVTAGLIQTPVVRLSNQVFLGI